MKYVRRALGGGLVTAAIVVSMVAASGSALSVDGGTLQALVLSGGPELRQPAAESDCTTPAASCTRGAVVVERSPSPSPDEAAQATPPPAGTGGGTPPTDPAADPLADRATLVQPCRGAADCVTYVIRAGDNLVSIVRYFDVAMSDTRKLNPWLDTAPHLLIGVELRLPWPAWLPGRPVPMQPEPTPGQASPDPTPGDPSPEASPPPDTMPVPAETPAPSDSPDPTAAPTSDPPESPSPPGP
jgi:hypothetical protein